MSKSNYSIRYNPERLRTMIEEGLSAKEIIKTLKISKHTLKEHLAMLQETDCKLYVIKGLMEEPEVEPVKPTIKKEGIIFSGEMLEKSGFIPGDSFEMSVEKDKIILKRIISDE